MVTKIVSTFGSPYLIMQGDHRWKLVTRSGWTRTGANRTVDIGLVLLLLSPTAWTLDLGDCTKVLEQTPRHMILESFGFPDK